MGIGSHWFKSYLSERTQRVKIGGITLTSMPITCGVPQGSRLGPSLFLCYVNDMELAVKCNLLLYADDSVLLASDKNPKVIAEMHSENLETCNDWLIDN